MELFDKFIKVIAEFEREGVEYVLIGGFAVVLHGFPRLTQDIDMFIRPTEENITKVRRALYTVFHDQSISEITLDEVASYSVIRYGTPDGFNIDLIANIGEAFTFDDIEYEVRDIERKKIKVATTESLIRMKEKTFREVDRIDL